MTALLELEGVSKEYCNGASSRIALDEVSLAVEGGELLGIWGQARSGRSTLLRVAAGLERPDRGVVRFAGRVLTRGSCDDARQNGLSYCRKTFRATDGRYVLDQLVTAQELFGVRHKLATVRAFETLEQVGAGTLCGALRPNELTPTETTLVSVARALLRKPNLLLIDEPAIGVDLLERDRIIALLRGIANDGIAVLMTTGVTTELSGSDRALFISNGRLRGDPAVPDLAPVVHLEDLARRRSA